MDVRPLIAFRKALDTFLDELKRLGIDVDSAGQALKAGMEVGAKAAGGEPPTNVIPMRQKQDSAPELKPKLKPEEPEPDPPPVQVPDSLAAEESQIYTALADGGQQAIKDIAETVALPVHKVRTILAKLMGAGFVTRTGEKRGTRYELTLDVADPVPQHVEEEATSGTTARKKKAKKKSAVKKAAAPPDDAELVLSKLTMDEGVLLSDLAEETEISEKKLGKLLADLAECGLVDESDPEDDEEGEVFYYLAAEGK